MDSSESRSPHLVKGNPVYYFLVDPETRLRENKRILRFIVIVSAIMCSIMVAIIVATSHQDTTTPVSAPATATPNLPDINRVLTDAEWDLVAQCESGGNWSIIGFGDLGYGGLQMNQRVWDAQSGEQFADRPDHATREQQIVVAQRYLRKAGSVDWPCVRYALGLQKSFYH